jgi:hypothetical protein
VGANRVTYPPGNSLTNSLSIVARLIKGGLGARIYHVSLGGFDTHAGQANVHASLLGTLSEGLQLFYQDLELDGHADRVLGITFSEFGRRVEENGSGGTDHGSAAPLFVIGSGIAGGVLGADPAVDALDMNGNLPHTFDFRSLYGTVLQDWFGADRDLVTNALLGFEYDRLPLIESSTVATEPSVPARDPSQNQVVGYPNPFRTSATIRFALDTGGPVELALYDATGRKRRTLVERTLPQGLHQVSLDGEGLESGTYYCRLTSEGGAFTTPLVHVR